MLLAIIIVNVIIFLTCQNLPEECLVGFNLFIEFYAFEIYIHLAHEHASHCGLKHPDLIIS